MRRYVVKVIRSHLFRLFTAPPPTPNLLAAALIRRKVGEVVWLSGHGIADWSPCFQRSETCLLVLTIKLEGERLTIRTPSR